MRLASLFLLPTAYSNFFFGCWSNYALSRTNTAASDGTPGSKRICQSISAMVCTWERGFGLCHEYVHDTGCVGKLSLHVINSTFSALIQVLALAYIAIQFGPLELGVAWLVLSVVILFIMAPIVHRKFGLGNYGRWVRVELLQPVLGVTVGIAVCWLLDIIDIHTIQMTDRSALLGTLLAFGFYTLSISILCAEDLRKNIWPISTI